MGQQQLNQGTAQDHVYRLPLPRPHLPSGNHLPYWLDRSCDQRFLRAAASRHAIHGVRNRGYSRCSYYGIDRINLLLRGWHLRARAGQRGRRAVAPGSADDRWSRWGG